MTTKIEAGIWCALSPPEIVSYAMEALYWELHDPRMERGELPAVPLTPPYSCPPNLSWCGASYTRFLPSPHLPLCEMFSPLFCSHLSPSDSLSLSLTLICLSHMSLSIIFSSLSHLSLSLSLSHLSPINYLLPSFSVYL